MSEILDQLRKAVVEGEDDLAVRLSQEALDASINPIAISKIIISGIGEAGELWKKNIYFQSDVVMSAEAFRAAMEVVEPHMAAGEAGASGKVIIGTVAGDMHNLGKIMVIAMLRAALFEVIDLGEDVPGSAFIEKVEEIKPDILGLGCYMTTTMLEVKDIIKDLEKKGLRSGVKVMIGGVPTTQEFAEECRADAWGRDALDAVEKARQIMEVGS